MRFKAKKDSFSDPKFLPRWQIHFFKGMSIRIDARTADDHCDLIRFFEANLAALESRIGADYCHWSFIYKDGVIRKQVGFYPSEGFILPKDQGVLLKFEDEGPIYASNSEYRENALKWGCKCVPIFEALIIEYCEKFMLDNPSTLESPIAYGG